MHIHINILLLFLLILNNGLHSQVSFDNYANIHTIGISLDADNPDPESDLSIKLEYKTSSATNWIEGFEFVQANTYNTNIYNSSIFYCTPSTEYYIKAILIDPSTPSLNGIFMDTIITQNLLPITTYLNTYYVSPLADDPLFTMSSPGNFQHALDSVSPGDRIILLAGTYNIGELNFDKSGTGVAPITIEGISEGSVIIDGSDPTISWEVDLGVLGFKTLISNANCNVVIADGVRLYPHKSIKELKYHNIAWESNCRDADVDGFFRSGNNNVLRLKFRDGSNPNTKDIKIGKYNHFMKLSGSQNIRFSKLDFKYFGSRNQAAILLNNSSDIRFDSCHFEFNDIGIKLEENTNNIIVDNCEFSDGNGSWNFWRMKATYQGVYLADCSGNNPFLDNLPGSNVVNLSIYNYRGLEKGGIFVSGNYTGRGMIIKNSSFHDIVQGVSIRPQAWWLNSNGITSEIDFYNNVVYNCSEDGLEADVYPRNVRIWNNTFHDVNAAISLASGADGPIYLFRNIFYNFTTDTTWISDFGNYNPGRPLKINSGHSGTGIDNTGHLYFMHNSVFSRDEHYSMDLLKPSPQVWKKITLLNNILQAENQFALRVRASIFGEIHSDFNNLYNDITNLIYYDENVYSNLNDFTTQHTLDSNSFYSNPLFVSPSTYDFNLSAESPGIDAGVIIPGLNTDFEGVAPDIGANEFSIDIVNTFEVEESTIINFSPNPVSAISQLEISSPSTFTKADLTVYNMEAKAIHRQIIYNKKSSIDLRHLIPGTYILSINLGNRIYAKKIIKI